VLAEELGLLLAPPFAQRRDEWLEDLARRLHDLERTVTGFRFDDLSRNEQFVSATIQATQAALQTHQREKLEALRNTVLNTALGKGGDNNRRGIFLSLVDRFTAAHLRILSKLDNPSNYEAWRNAPPRELNERRGPVEWVKAFVPGLDTEDPGLVKILIDDLQRAGLVGMKGDDPYIPRDWDWMTVLGRKFLRFISNPQTESTNE